MDGSVIFLKERKDGSFEFPDSQFFNADEPWDTLDKLVNVKEEQGTLHLDGKEFTVTIYIEQAAGWRFPYVLLDDVRKLQ